MNRAARSILPLVAVAMVVQAAARPVLPAFKAKLPLAAVEQEAAQATLQTSVACDQYVSGIEYNPVALADYPDMQSYDLNQNTYDLSVCTTSTKPRCVNGALCVYSGTVFQHVLARWETYPLPTWQPYYGESTGVTVAFANGDSCPAQPGSVYQVKLNLVCRTRGSVYESYTVVADPDNPECGFVVTVPSSAACPIQPPAPAPAPLPDYVDGPDAFAIVLLTLSGVIGLVTIILCCCGCRKSVPQPSEPCCLPNLNTCCCGCSLQGAAIFIAILEAFAAAGWMAFGSVMLVLVPIQWDYNSDAQQNAIIDLTVFAGVILGVGCLALMTSMVGCFGARPQNYKSFRVFYYWYHFGTVLNLLLGIGWGMMYAMVCDGDASDILDDAVGFDIGCDFVITGWLVAAAFVAFMIRLYFTLVLRSYLHYQYRVHAAGPNAGLLANAVIPAPAVNGVQYRALPVNNNYGSVQQPPLAARPQPNLAGAAPPLYPHAQPMVYFQASPSAPMMAYVPFNSAPEGAQQAPPPYHGGLAPAAAPVPEHDPARAI